MTDQVQARKALVGAKRIVVKIGSRALVQGEVPGTGRFQSMADQIADVTKLGHTVVLVSSGAVALGCQHLGIAKRPTMLPELQAVAAIGQPRLMSAYATAFAKHDMHVAQILLTHAELADRQRYRNAGAAMDAMIQLGTVPIINENDTVATEELQFGDNDQLAAMLAPMAGAQLLVLLTDVEGLLDQNRARIPLVEDFDAVQRMIWPKENELSLGGMASKLGAARRACSAGLPVVIAKAQEPDVLRRIVTGEDVGTLFLPTGEKLPSRDYWIVHTMKSRGQLVINEGAVQALTVGKRSLLPVGIKEAHGDFRAGDAVTVTSEDGRELARGLSRYDARDVQRLLGKHSGQIRDLLGFYAGDEIIHRDDLVML